jgi:hypothetical protein
MPAEFVTGLGVEAPELGLELWAQSAAGKKTTGRISEQLKRTIGEMNARKRCHWLVILSAEAMKL